MQHEYLDSKALEKPITLMNASYATLERDILPAVIKPSRYTGNELNVIRKDHAAVPFRVVLAFPDTYELGMSYLGFGILYHLLNRRPDVLAERVFAPWVDMEQILRQRRIPLFALESKAPLRSFDLIAFTLPYELCNTNILNMLDLAGIPLKGEERSQDDPLVLAGGLGAYNPEPLADFIDAFVIGDGEEVIHEIVDTLKTTKGAPRRERLGILAESKGLYVPSLYTGDIRGGPRVCPRPAEAGAPERIEARTVEHLAYEHYPEKPLVPFTEIEHDRLTIEIMRGCPRGCRFCNASVLYRPLRERPLEDILRQAEQSISSTGYDEISLLSLSATDYSQIDELIPALNRTFASRRVSVALPSLRPDTLTRELAKSVQAVRKSSLTFAPEAGTQRLRQVIHKRIREEDLLQAVDIAFSLGWNLIKLYFMIGLPTETQEDIEAIVRLVRSVQRISHRHGGDKHLNVAISPFSPKAHTPFQWAAQDPVDQLQEKSAYLKEHLQHRRITVKWRDPEVSFVETVFARGDRRLGRTLIQAYRSGCRLDGWSDFFSYPLWQKAFELSGVDPRQYTSSLAVDQTLPWEHIAIGLSRETLWREWVRSQQAETTVCAEPPLRPRDTDGLAGAPAQDISPSGAETEASTHSYGRSRRKRTKTPLQVARAKIRMKYQKGEEVRFLSHLDLVRVFERALRRTELPIAYSQGFHPHPKIAFGPPLALGMTSRAEYIDMQFEQPYSHRMIEALNQTLPAGLRILQAKPIFGKTPSLSSTIQQAEYVVQLFPDLSLEQADTAIRNCLRQADLWVRREVKGDIREVNIRPHILALEATQENGHVSLRLRVRTSEAGHAKPIEVIGQIVPLDPHRSACLPIERTEQFIEDQERLASPMDCV